MLRKALLCALIGALMVAAPSVIAQTSSKATTFSFASDRNHDAPTFQSKGGLDILNVDDTVFDLIVDMNSDAAGGLVTFQSLHSFVVQLSDHTSTPCGAGFLHTWKAKGLVTFSHFNGNTGFPMILRIIVGEGVFSSYSPNSNTLGDTATLQESNAVSGGSIFTAGAQLIGIGVPQAAIDLQQGYAYTFTYIRDTAGNPYPAINLKTGEFTDAWVSEGSFSAGAEAGGGGVQADPL